MVIRKARPSRLSRSDRIRTHREQESLYHRPYVLDLANRTTQLIQLRLLESVSLSHTSHCNDREERLQHHSPARIESTNDMTPATYPGSPPNANQVIVSAKYIVNAIAIPPKTRFGS